MQWVRHDPLNRRAELVEILPCIRLQFLDPSFLKGVIDCEDFAPPDMQRCRDYLANAYESLTSHRYCRLPPHRAPIKPLVICKCVIYFLFEFVYLFVFRLCGWLF
jgi:hypothetical protein